MKLKKKIDRVAPSHGRSPGFKSPTAHQQYQGVTASAVALFLFLLTTLNVVISCSSTPSAGFSAGNKAGFWEFGVAFDKLQAC